MLTGYDYVKPNNQPQRNNLPHYGIGHPIFLETAWKIGSDLIKHAVWDGDRCNWMGNTVEPVEGEFRVVFRSLGPEIYGGTSGIALFLSQLYKVCPDPLLQETMEPLRRWVLARMHSKVLPLLNLPVNKMPMRS